MIFVKLFLPNIISFQCLHRFRTDLLSTDVMMEKHLSIGQLIYIIVLNGKVLE